MAVLSSYNFSDVVKVNILKEMCTKVLSTLEKWDSIFTVTGGKLYQTMKLFNGFQILSPFFLAQTAVSKIPEYIDMCLLCPEFFNNTKDLKEKSMAEIPLYIAAAQNVDENVDILAWWRGKKHTLQAFYKILGQAVLYQPTSATAERSFSLLDSIFGDESASALEDAKEGSVMLRVNDTQRYKEKKELEGYVEDVDA